MSLQVTERGPSGEKVGEPGRRPMSPRRKIAYGIVAVYVVGLVVFALVFGIHEHQNNQFNIVSPFHLVTWFQVGPIAFNLSLIHI